MSCYHPILARKSRYKNSLGKYSIKIVGKDVHPDQVDNTRDFMYEYITLPCGKCLGCKKDHARDWMVRCYLESFYYDHYKNWFVTLTYDDAHLGSPSLDKKDFQNFIKSLRAYMLYHYGSENIRYVLAGEYGSISGRKHGHVLLFNCKLPDLVPADAINGHVYFTSKILSDCWSKGMVFVSNFTLATAMYVAQYTFKKSKVNKNSDKYFPEFILSSNRPGIGYQYFLDFYRSIIKDNGVIIRGKLYAPPKYFYKVMEQLGIDCQSVKDYWITKKEKEILNKFYTNRDMKSEAIAREINDVSSKCRGDL